MPLSNRTVRRRLAARLAAGLAGAAAPLATGCLTVEPADSRPRVPSAAVRDGADGCDGAGAWGCGDEAWPTGTWEAAPSPYAPPLSDEYPPPPMPYPSAPSEAPFEAPAPSFEFAPPLPPAGDYVPPPALRVEPAGFLRIAAPE